jgi:DNA-directed RNA polymerase subunit K/omega
MKQENDLEIEEEVGATSDGEESIDPELNEDDDNNELDNEDESLSDDDEIDDVDDSIENGELQFKDDENDNNMLNNESSLFNISKNDYDNIDLENNDSMEFLQKFTKEYKTDYILNNHQESLNKNYNEIKQFINVTKDNNNNIIDAFHKTIPILTKYEKTKIIGIRLKQLNNGAKPYVTLSDTILDNNMIVNMELTQKVLPFIVSRPLPNNTYEYWKLQDLELL